MVPSCFVECEYPREILIAQWKNKNTTGLWGYQEMVPNGPPIPKELTWQISKMSTPFEQRRVTGPAQALVAVLKVSSNGSRCSLAGNPLSVTGCF